MGSTSLILVPLPHLDLLPGKHVPFSAARGQSAASAGQSCSSHLHLLSFHPQGHCHRCSRQRRVLDASQLFKCALMGAGCPSPKTPAAPTRPGIASGGATPTAPDTRVHCSCIQAADSVRKSRFYFTDSGIACIWEKQKILTPVGIGLYGKLS